MFYNLRFGRKDRSKIGILQFCFLAVTVKVPLCHKHQRVPSSSSSCCCGCYSVSKSCPTLCDPMDYSSPGFPVLHHLPELAQTHVCSVSDAIQPSHPLSPPSPPASIFPSFRVFSNEAALCIRWPKYWSFSFSISPSNEYSELISFRMDWFDLLDVQHMWKDFNKAPSIVLGILASLSVFCQYLSYRLGVESLFSACHKASFALCPFCL